MPNTIWYICECGSPASVCAEEFELTLEEAQEIREHRDSGWYVISNVCKRGPEPTDQLVERSENYSIYREAL